jgi:autotransporter-associated beta strand protein
LVALALAVLCGARSSQATSLYWNALGSANPGPSDGSGTWLTAGNWWDGAANATWSSLNPDSATFGAGVDGSYTITLGGNVTNSSIAFNNSGYTLSGAGVLAFAANSTITVASGVTAAINCTNWAGNSSQVWTVNPNATLNVGGNIQGMQVKWLGSGTLNLTGTNTPAIFWGNTTINQTAGSVAPTAYSFIGYQGGPGAYTLNGAAALTMNSGDLTIARGGQTGSLIIKNGTANIGTSGSTIRNLNLASSDNNAGNHATVDVQGGTLNVGSATLAGAIRMMAAGGGSGESATMTIEGGTVNAQLIGFGSAANTYSTSSTNKLVVSGGTLYLGAGGIIESNAHPVDIVTLSGGTVGASANWSCALDIDLGSSGGPVTFQAADSASVAKNITLSGALTNTQGFVKTGAGTLTLSGANTYSDTTTINAGTVALTGLNGAISSSSAITIGSGATLAITNSATANNANRLSDTAPFTMNGGTFNYLNDGSAASFSETAGPLIISSGVNTINVNPAASGQTSTLTFSSLTVSGSASVNFVGAGIGTSLNRIFFTAPPGSLTGITVNGNAAGYDAINGLKLGVTYTDIAAQGATVPDGAANKVRINSAGSGGNDQLAATVTSVNQLLQNFTTPCVVATASKTLRAQMLQINLGMASLTIGASPNDGTLTAGTAGGTLTLENDSINNLTINAVIANNTSASSLIKSGTGPVVLTANNTFSGTAVISSGTLALNGAGSLSAPVTINGGTLAVNGSASLSGPVTVSAGTLALSGSAPLGSSSVTVAANGALDVSGRASSLTLGDTQTLVGTGISASSFINCSGSSGLILGGNASLQLNFSPGTPTFTVTGGSLLLNTNNRVTVTISNGGARLGLGSYKLIDNQAGGTVAGLLPMYLTLAGDGAVSGANPFLQLSGGALYLVLSTALTWDANTSLIGAQDGSGTWDPTSANWWANGSDVVWNGTNDAVFGTGIDGTYTVNLASNLTANSLTFNNSGYTLTGTNTLTLANNGGVTVAPGKAATIDCTLYNGNGAEYFTANSNATLNIGGKIQAMQVRWQGQGTLNLTGGVHTPSIFWANTTVNQTAGSMTPGVYSYIGFSSPNNVPGNYTLGGTATMTMNGGGNNGNLTIGRGGSSGTFTLQGGAAANFGISGNNQCAINVMYDNSAGQSGVLNVQGGTLTMGNSTPTNLIYVMQTGGTASNYAAVNISGGTVSVPGIKFGNDITDYSSSTAELNLTGGALYLGSAGLFQGAYSPFNTTVTLSGGTIGALSDWSSAMNLVLTNSGGNIAFQAGDAANAAHDITLAGTLSGPGGLTKTGRGMLTLSGSIGYTGLTIVSNGTLVAQTGLNPAGDVVVSPAAGGSASLYLANTVNSLTVNSGGAFYPGGPGVVNTLAANTVTCNAGSSLYLDVMSAWPQGSDWVDAQTLVINGPTRIVPNFLTTSVNPGDRFPVLGYTSASGLGNLVLDPSVMNSRLALSLDNGVAGEVQIAIGPGGTVPNASLTWYGNNPNQNWDFTTPNWYYGSEKFYNLDSVTFDDYAQTSQVNLTGPLYPAAVTFNNYSLPYTLSGSGKISGATALVLNGAASVTVATDNDNTGGVTINGPGASLQIGAGGTKGSIGSGKVTFTAAATGASLVYARSDALALNQAIIGAGSDPARLLVNSGTLTLGGPDNNSNLEATVNGGTLVLNKASSANGLTIGAAGTVSGGGTVQGPASVAGTLAHNGTISGPVSIQAGGVLSPGGSAALAQLTLSSSLSMDPAATYVAQINRAANPNSDRVVVGHGLATVAGTLTVTNLGGALTSGDTFFLFSTAVGGAFTTVNLPAGYTWTNKLAVDGSIQVLAVNGLPSTPTNVSFTVNNGNLTLSWPSNYVGWILQTNSINVGVSSNWYDVPGSQTNSQLTFPMNNPAIKNEFFRLRHP